MLTQEKSRRAFAFLYASLPQPPVVDMVSSQRASRFDHRQNAAFYCIHALRVRAPLRFKRTVLDTALIGLGKCHAPIATPGTVFYPNLFLCY